MTLSVSYWITPPRTMALPTQKPAGGAGMSRGRGWHVPLEHIARRWRLPKIPQYRRSDHHHRAEGLTGEWREDWRDTVQLEMLTDLGFIDGVSSD